MDKRVEAAERIIQNEYQKPLRISGLARQVGASRSHLAYLFKKEMGLSMTDYLCDLRLSEAEKLLNADHTSVKQAALSVGYRNPSKFARDFKNYFGKLPSAAGADSCSVESASSRREPSFAD